jgi:hypothetical protein
MLKIGKILGLLLGLSEQGGDFAHIYFEPNPDKKPV